MWMKNNNAHDQTSSYDIFYQLTKATVQSNHIQLDKIQPLI